MGVTQQHYQCGIESELGNALRPAPSSEAWWTRRAQNHRLINRIAHEGVQRGEHEHSFAGRRGSQRARQEDWAGPPARDLGQDAIAEECLDRQE